MIASSSGDPWPQLIDFGRSIDVGNPHFKEAAGTFMYNSIRSGSTNDRMPADDIESLGWVLLRLVYGHLPWRRDKNATDAKHEEQEDRMRRMTKEKIQFLDSGPELLGRYYYCPPELAAFLRYCHQYLHGTERAA